MQYTGGAGETVEPSAAGGQHKRAASMGSTVHMKGPTEMRPMSRSTLLEAHPAGMLR